VFGVWGVVFNIYGSGFGVGVMVSEYRVHQDLGGRVQGVGLIIDRGLEEGCERAPPPHRIHQPDTRTPSYSARNPTP